MEIYDQARDFDGNTNLKDSIPIKVGQSFYRFTVKDKSAGSLKAFCDEVCTSGSEIFPSLTFKLKKSKGATCTSYTSDYEGEDKYRFRCIACHSKICSKYGLGTFGPLYDDDGAQGLVDEPLDGTIPECSLPANNSGGKYDLPSIAQSAEKCVALTNITGMDSFKNFKTGAQNYKYLSCTSRLPVLCFSSGHYMPAMEFSSSQPTKGPSLFKGQFSEAQSACYKMGREILKKQSLAQFFKQFWSIKDPEATIITHIGLPVLTGNTAYFDYVNNATRGIFVAPTYDIQALSRVLKEGFFKKFLDAKQNKMWVAMSKDKGGQLIGSIPLAEIASSNAAVFRRKEHPYKPTLLRNTNTLSSSGKDTVLTHNIQYKGVYNVNGSSGARKALCRKGPGDFVLTGASSLKNAPAQCQALSAHFVPPLSSLEWVKAMTLLNKNDTNYPFPNPGDLKDNTNYIKTLSVPAPSVYVALTKQEGNGENTGDWRLNKTAYFDEASSLFFTEDIPDPGNEYVGLIDYKGLPVMEISGKKINSDMSFLASVNINSTGFKKVCITKDTSTQQVTGLSTVDISQSCGQGTEQLKESDLKVYLKSVRFMSLWVQENKSGEFIVGDHILEAITQAKNKKCKNECKGKQAAFKAQCISKLTKTKTVTVCNDVTDPVTKITTQVCHDTTVTVPPSPQKVQACLVQACGDCTGKCDFQHDISSHTWSLSFAGDAPPYCP